MKDPVDHVQRPVVPWRPPEVLTECGKNDVARVISRGDFWDRVKEQGEQRAAMSVCMTCWSTAKRWSGVTHRAGRGAMSAHEARERFVNPWPFDPLDVLRRDADSYGPRAEALRRELRVLTMMVAAHQDEFDEAMSGIDDTVSMAELRSVRATKQRKAR